MCDSLSGDSASLSRLGGGGRAEVLFCGAEHQILGEEAIVFVAHGVAGAKLFGVYSPLQPLKTELGLLDIVGSCIDMSHIVVEATQE